MTDRELLELAAKAAGEVTELWHGNVNYMDGVLMRWNPLTDDGDALRLAVKLNLHIGIDAETSGCITIEWEFDTGGNARYSIEQDAPEGGDDYAATRRAIVRAAAEIWKAM